MLSPESYLPFKARLKLRENILAFISRDVGLCDFLVPPDMTASWTPEQRKLWTDSIVDTFLQADASSGKAARRRLMSYETASALRRACVKLRRRTADHRDVIKTSVSLEALWNGVSVELEDATWARCSLLFDTAMISLRVAYLWMYMKAEGGGNDVPFEVKKSMFEMLVSSYFTVDAPTDDQVDKHSDNFGKLLEAWRAELLKYTESDKFEKRMLALEKSQSLDETANCIEKFLARANVDDNWVYRMYQTDREIAQGLWIRRKGKRKSAKNSSISPDPDNSVSSFEPRDADSDFDVQGAEGMDDEEDSHESKDNSEQVEDADQQRSSRRNSMATRSTYAAKGNVRITRQGKNLLPNNKGSLSKPQQTATPISKRSARLKRRAEPVSNPRSNGRRKIQNEQDPVRNEPSKKARKIMFDREGSDQKVKLVASNGTQPGQVARNIRATKSPQTPSLVQNATEMDEGTAEVAGAGGQVAIKQLPSQRAADLATKAPSDAAGNEMNDDDHRRSGGKEVRIALAPEVLDQKSTENTVAEAEYDVPSYPDNAKKGSRPVVRDQAANASGKEKRQRATEGIAANGEGHTEVPRRPNLRRSPRTTAAL